MDRWAATVKYDVNFICACVLGDASAGRLSRQFGRELKLKHTINGYIDNRKDMPAWGQLGCSGFIILDEKHQVVSHETSAFMEVRDLAFRHVEAILDALSEKRPLPYACPGEMVRLLPAFQGAAGAQGVCLKVEGDVLAVQLLSGPQRNRVVQVPVAAVRKLGDETEEPVATKRRTDGDNEGASDAALLDKSFVSEALRLPSVQVPSMDEEHAECAWLLEQLVAQKSATALKNVLDCFVEHFEHEESLFDEFGFGEHVNERLSAKKSHKNDHARLLAKIRQQLASSRSEATPAAFVREVIEDFHEHATKYDVLYGDHLQAKGAK